jgi:hypothetical protein
MAESFTAVKRNAFPLKLFKGVPGAARYRFTITSRDCGWSRTFRRLVSIRPRHE